MNLAYCKYEPPGFSDENLCPVLFLHGAGDSKEIWGNIPRLIAEKTNRQAYALDARNHGDSEWTEIFSFDKNLDDLMHFLDTHSIEKCVLVGHSMGGTTCIRAALRFPQRIEMVFIEEKYVQLVGQRTYNSAIKYFQLCQEAAKRIPTDCTENEVHRRIADYLFEKLKANKSREYLDNIFFATKRSDSGGYSLKANLRVINKAMEDGESLLSAPQGLYEGPACFIYGSTSSFRVGERKEHIRQFFPKAEFYEIDGADHYIHPHFPEKFIEIIVQGLLKHKI